MSLPRSLAAVPLFAALAAVSVPAAAESVVFDTVFGSFEVNLFEDATPLHVANFLEYVDAGDYDSSVFHRAAELDDGSEFVVQGGGFTFDGTPLSAPSELTEIASRGPVTNEPGISNTRGTLALARVGGQENSGTNQFFFNLQDNTGLDDVDGGFTVFGEVADASGLSILDQIAAVPTFVGAAPFGEIPLRNFDVDDIGVEDLGADQFVIVNSITRVDVVDPVDPIAPVDPASVPTPGAAVAGLFGLAGCVLRRRRA